MSIDQDTPNSQSDAEDELPDWLREIRGTGPASEPETSSETASSSTPIPDATQDDDEDLPDWLKEVQAEQTPPAAEAPTAADPVADDEDSGADLWQEILAEEGLTLDDLPEERPEGAEDMSLKDYLESTADESARLQAQSAAATPSTPAGPVEEEADDDSAGSDLWKQILAEEGLALDDLDEERPEGAGDMSLKDYLESTADESARLQAQSAAGVPPSSETPAEEDEAEPEAVGAAVDIDDDVEDDLPDWLREDQPAETEASGLSWLSDESTHDEEAEEDEVEAPEIEAATREASVVEDDGIVVEDELPDWLREDQPVEAEASGLSWLNDESTHDEEAEEDEVEAPEIEAATSEASVVEDDGIVVEDELPDWLREDQPVEAEASSLSWLNDESTHDEGELEEVLAENASDIFDSEDFADDEDLPDWLTKEVELDSAELEIDDEEVETFAEAVQATEAAITADTEDEDDGIVDVEGLPDWLRDEQVASDTTLDSDEEEEAPAWLTDTGEETVEDLVEEASDDTEEDVPDWLHEAETEDDLEPVTASQAESDDLGVENLPEWLDASVVEDDALGDEAIDVSDVDAEESQIPSWLESLRNQEAAEQPETDYAVAFGTSEDIDDTPEVAEAEPELEPEREVPVPAEVVPAEAAEMADERLAVANASLDAGQFEEAIQIYQALISNEEQLEKVTEALTNRLGAFEDRATIYELLGDAHMMNGRLDQALEHYRLALQKV